MKTKINEALHKAARHGETKEVEQLLDKGADVDYRDEEGRTALMKAVNYPSLETVWLLLEYGADINLDDKYGHTALRIAAIYDYPEIAKLLEAKNKMNGFKRDTTLENTTNTKEGRIKKVIWITVVLTIVIVLLNMDIAIKS